MSETQFINSSTVLSKEFVVRNKESTVCSREPAVLSKDFTVRNKGLIVLSKEFTVRTKELTVRGRCLAAGGHPRQGPSSGVLPVYFRAPNGCSPI